MTEYRKPWTGNEDFKDAPVFERPMSKKIHWEGSVLNCIQGNSRGKFPQVGMGVTELCYSDRHAYEIIEICLFTSGPKKGQIKTIKIRELEAVRTDNNGISETQSYQYFSKPDGQTRTLCLYRGKWRERSYYTKRKEVPVDNPDGSPKFFADGSRYTERVDIIDQKTGLPKTGWEFNCTSWYVGEAKEYYDPCR